MREVHVIGAGISGLATAWYLTEAGVPVRVFESAPRPGGLIQTHRLEQGLAEAAARAFTRSDRTMALFRALGLQPVSPRARSRYIYRAGRPRRWPLTLAETADTVGHVAAAWAKRDMAPRLNETADAWGRRVLGAAATTWLLTPVLQGIYAAAPGTLSALAILGRHRPRRGGLVTPPRGMGEFIDRLHDALVARGVVFEFGAPVDRLDPRVPAVIATNAPSAARLLAPHAPALAAVLARIRMVSLVTTTAFFEPRAGDCRGFGVLFPRSSGVRALGVLFNSDAFEGRSAFRSETWIYGDLSAQALPRADEAATVVCADRARLTGQADPPIAWHATRQIEALPLYDEVVLEAQAGLSRLPDNVTLAGNYLGRLGVSALVDAAAGAADRARACRLGVAA